MSIEQRAVAPLKIFLVVLFGILVVFQFLSIPGGIAYNTRQNPNDAPLRWPLTFIAGFLILCVQVVIVSTWKLLGMVSNGRIFTEASMRWVDAIVWAIGAAWLVVVGMFIFVGFNADDPGMPMVMLLLVVGGAVLELLMLVMRALLRQATTLQTDMDAVL